MVNYFMKSFFVFLLFLSVVSCKKEHNPIPQTSANILIYSIDSDPQYSALRSPLQSVYVTTPQCVGFNCNGIVLFRVKVEGAYNDYRAFDRSCTYEGGDCVMEIDPYFPDLLICPCCKSIFNMIGGYMQQGPAKFPLREFECSYMDGDLYIH